MSNRAMYRRQAKADEKKSKTFTVTNEQLDSMVKDAAEKLAWLAFKESYKKYSMAEAKIRQVAERVAHKRMFGSWGDKRNEEFLRYLNDGIAEVNRMIHDPDRKKLAKYCSLNGIDAEEIFGIRPVTIEADPDLNEDGDLIILMDDGEEAKTDGTV